MGTYELIFGGNWETKNSLLAYCAKSYRLTYNSKNQIVKQGWKVLG